MVRAQLGTVLKKSGSWVGRYSRWTLDNSAGQKQRLQKSFTIGRVDEMTKAEARRVLRIRIEEELHLRADSRTTLAWFIEQRWKPLRESGWRPSTKEVNEYLLGIITERFGTVPLEQADPVAMQLWIDGLAKTRSASAVRHIRILLKSIFAEAVEEDYIRKSAARLLRVPATLKPVRKDILTTDQMKTLLGVASGMDRVILLLLFTTGLRPSELFGLRWKSFDAEHKLMHIVESVYRGEEREYTKTTDQNSRRELQIIYLHDMVVSALQELHASLPEWRAAPDTHIFSNAENGGPLWKENWVYRNLNKIICCAFHDGKCAGTDVTSTKCRGNNVPRVSFQISRRSVATHAQSLGSGKLSAAEYVQPVEEAVRATVDSLAEKFLT